MPGRMRRSVAGFGATRDRDAVHDRCMRIAAVSDTHLPKFGKALPRALVDAIGAAQIDLIVHLPSSWRASAGAKCSRWTGRSSA